LGETVTVAISIEQLLYDFMIDTIPEFSNHGICCPNNPHCKHSAGASGPIKLYPPDATPDEVKHQPLPSIMPPPTQLPKHPSEAKPTTSTPSGEPASSMPWSIIVVLIVAAIGLLWLLLKGRK
jgi:hypothetical protein